MMFELKLKNEFPSKDSFRSDTASGPLGYKQTIETTSGKSTPESYIISIQSEATIVIRLEYLRFT